MRNAYLNRLCELCWGVFLLHEPKKSHVHVKGLYLGRDIGILGSFFGLIFEAQTRTVPVMQY